MKLKALILSLFAITLVLGCTRNEPAEETVPPAPEFDTMDTMEDGTGMDDPTGVDDGATMDENTDDLEDDTTDGSM